MVLWAAELRESGKHLVLCGDFNIARLGIDVHPALRKEMIGQSQEERTLFEQFLCTA
jgi:exonuclease III